MPNYYIPKDKFKVVSLQDITSYVEKAGKTTKVLIALTWLTGARIGELLRLKKQDVNINFDQKEITLSLVTLKRRTPFIRDLSFSFIDPFITEVIIPHVQKLKFDESKLFKKTDVSYRVYLRQLNRLIHGDDKTKWINYHYLRHSRLTWLGRKKRASVWEIQAWTGHKDVESIAPYIIHESPKRFKGKLAE